MIFFNSCSEALPADYGYFGCVLFGDIRANDVLDSIIFYSKESLDSIIFNQWNHLYTLIMISAVFCVSIQS